jgi:hypothetical protein
MKGPAESGQICSVGRRKIAKKIAKNKRCYANTMARRNALFEVKQIEQLDLINRLLTHHGRPPR